ncbi:MAG: hypothetical protein QOF11_2115, partial [Chloroflexota bacterium]|nr:hypothetical protein [Chloroflexota bacterium]
MGGAGGDEPAPAAKGGPSIPPPGERGSRRGFRDQFAATRSAVIRLATAHVALARVELEEILTEVKRVVALIAVAIALIIFAAILLTVGMSLFLGEWLFGSMGWGVLHDTELAIALAIMCVLAAFGVPLRRLARGFFIAA